MLLSATAKYLNLWLNLSFGSSSEYNVMIFLLFALILKLSNCIDSDVFQFGPYNDNFDDESGERIVSDEWRLYGSAKAFSSFIRLTPDRQSKQGAIWSRGPTESTSINAVLEFRIAGQGKKLFGDGLGFWMINQPFYRFNLFIRFKAI